MILYFVGSEEFFIFKKGKICGQVFEGMICVEDELGIGMSYDGILVLLEDIVVGIFVWEYFNIEIDYVYEIGLMFNCLDVINYLGVVKDLVVYFKVNYSYNDGVYLFFVDGFKVDD